MNLMPAPVTNGPIVYPESDGKPLAENTKQLRWIVVLYGNLAALFSTRPDVFVAADLGWYPRQGEEGNTAPDVMVVFGRPKGDRTSYLQWQENDIPVTVVFEILSPSNRFSEMINKEAFYEDHGVEEYYIYDPDSNELWIYLRKGTVLRRVHREADFISPRLGIRFEMTTPEMTVYGPDGLPFLSFEQTIALLEEARKSATEARKQVEQMKQVMTRLTELGRKARRQQASEEELRELERLEEETSAS